MFRLSDYLDGREADAGASLRVQYKLAFAGSRRLKLYAKLAAGSHIDENYQLTRSGSARSTCGSGGQSSSPPAGPAGSAPASASRQASRVWPSARASPPLRVIAACFFQ